VSLLIGMGTPAILPIAYLLHEPGAVAFTVLEVALVLGILLGSLGASRIPAPATLQAMIGSLWVFAVACFAVAVTPVLAGAVIAIAVTGFGNSVYSVTNRSALMRAADSGKQGTVLTARFSIAQGSQVLGLGAGALLVAAVGPRLGFAVVGLGLTCLAALYALHRAQSAARCRSLGPTRPGAVRRRQEP
jgi:hypothetical protein